MSQEDAIKTHYARFVKRYDELPHTSARNHAYQYMADYVLSGREDAAVRILELGIGTGYFTRFLVERAPKSHVTGVDISPDMLTKAQINLRPFQKQIQLICGAIPAAIPFAAFDVVVSAAALCFEVIPYDELFRTVWERLIAGGTFAYMVDTEMHSPICRQKRMQMAQPSVPPLTDDQRAFLSWVGRDLDVSVRFYPIEWHFDRLRRAGFPDADCIYLCHDCTIYAGEKNDTRAIS